MSQQVKPQPLPPQPAQANVILRCSGLKKSFRMGDSTIHVLKGVDLTVREREFIAIEGRSGSGKSTLLHLLGALDEPSEGEIDYAGRNVAAMGATERSRLRNVEFGFVFQFYHLLPELNVLENTELAAMVQHSWLSFRSQKKEIRRRAEELLKRFGLDHRMKHRPQHLSGGERQRVAIARALMNNPKVLFADEPTGNLDVETGRQIMDVIEGIHRATGQTIVMVTHDRSLAREADRVLVLKDGRMEKAES